MVRVTVPATSANMGSGYDSIGIALELYNVIDLAENDRSMTALRSSGSPSSMFAPMMPATVHAEDEPRPRVCGIAQSSTMVKPESGLPHSS